MKAWLDATQKEQALQCARRIADYLCDLQSPWRDNNPAAGNIAWIVRGDGTEVLGPNWTQAFACMGLLAAYKAFGDARYEGAALSAGRWLKSLQILDPFRPDDYGAIRELTPQTPWCYLRDAASAAYGFIELYRHTDDEEYLERACLFTQWFLRRAIDEDGWPCWGYAFDSIPAERAPHFRNDCQGCFHGGSLNLLYQLSAATGDASWTGRTFLRMADYLVTHIQQPSGYFATIERRTRKPPVEDPQYGLHRGNDDLSSLGLLGAYRSTGNEAYRRGVNRFVDAVLADQRADGLFDGSVASVPVVLNILYEADTELTSPADQAHRVRRALQRLFAAQADGAINMRMEGGLIEYARQNETVARSTSYGLIVLLKLFADVGDYLTVANGPSVPRHRIQPAMSVAAPEQARSTGDRTPTLQP